MSWLSRLVAAIGTAWTQAAITRAERSQTTSPARLGHLALAVAREEIGNGEERHNNRGPHIDRYLFGESSGGSWCAWFLSYCFAIAATRAGRKLPFERTGGAGRLAINAAKVGEAVPKGEQPKPGDLVLFERGEDGDWKKHIGIVESADLSGYMSIEGNVGKVPAKVKRRFHRYGRDRFLRFVRV